MRMRPIFLFLCAVSVAMMAHTFNMGFRYHYGMKALGQRVASGGTVEQSEVDDLNAIVPIHFVWGMGTGIFVCFVHSIVLVYFLGTGKAIKEQTELQNWDETDYQEARKHMSLALFPTAAGILLVIAAAFSGGFTLIQFSPPWVHLLVAAVGVLGQIPVYAFQYSVIRRNGKLMDRIVDRLGGENIRIAL